MLFRSFTAASGTGWRKASVHVSGSGTGQAGTSGERRDGSLRGTGGAYDLDGTYYVQRYYEAGTLMIVNEISNAACYNTVITSLCTA